MKKALGQHGRRLPRYRPDNHTTLHRTEPEPTSPTTTTPTPAGGDKRQLRGIPVVGASTGAVPGTNPLQALLDKEDEEPLPCRPESQLPNG